VILHRCFAWRRDARAPGEDGGPLFFAQPYQGDGRHDNPAIYGCLYTAEHEVSAIVESLRVFTGTVRLPSRLERRGLPLAVAAIELSDHEELVDLDEPRVLMSNRLRPSLVATGDRAITQHQALDLFRRNPQAAGLRWWSTFEALWGNVTLFDRAARSLSVASVRTLTFDDAAVGEAAHFLGLT
jgi:hypothetical protein